MALFAIGFAPVRYANHQNQQTIILFILNHKVLSMTGFMLLPSRARDHINPLPDDEPPDALLVVLTAPWSESDRRNLSRRR